MAGDRRLGRAQREGVERDEIEMAMREHGINDMKEVQMAVLEADGSISIVPTGSTVHKTKRRIRTTRRP